MVFQDSPHDAQDRFPCKLIINIPFPTSRLARTALRALAVDKELSSLVHRSFGLRSTQSIGLGDESDNNLVLQVEYSATTNRMLRVAVNGFFESLGVVIHAMEELDIDTIERPGTEPLQGVQGIEEIKD